MLYNLNRYDIVALFRTASEIMNFTMKFTSFALNGIIRLQRHYVNDCVIMCYWVSLILCRYCVDNVVNFHIIYRLDRYACAVWNVYSCVISGEIGSISRVARSENGTWVPGTCFHMDIVPIIRVNVVSRTYSSFGDRAFAAAGPVLWNSLPSHLKEADLLYSQFRRSLKAFLFG